jgi:hypothetical protein
MLGYIVLDEDEDGMTCWINVKEEDLKLGK